MLAYDYPLMAMFWTMTIFFLWAAWWIRRDLGIHRQLPTP